MPVLGVTNYASSAKDYSGIGSEFINLVVWDTTFAAPGTAGLLPLAKDVDIKDTQALQTNEGAGGNTYPLVGGVRKVEINVTHIQQDKASKDIYRTFLGLNTAMVIEGYRYGVNGKKQWTIIPACRVETSLEDKTPGSEFKTKWVGFPVSTTLTLNLVSMTAGMYNTSTCASFVIPPFEQCIRYEE